MSSFFLATFVLLVQSNTTWVVYILQKYKWFTIASFELQSRLEIPRCAYNLYLHSNSPLFNSITLGLVIAMKTSLRAIRITLSPLTLNVMQGSYKYQFLSHWFNPTLNRTLSLPFQKQTLYLLGHLSDNNFF